MDKNLIQTAHLNKEYMYLLIKESVKHTMQNKIVYKIKGRV